MEEIAKKRHSLAHLLARAVLEHYPSAKPTLGPAIDDGFYYDFEFQEAISDKELKAIEKTMRNIAGTWSSFERTELSAKEAEEHFKGNEYKCELIADITERKEAITLYRSGDFTDLCKGGHVDDFKDINMDAWKLDRIAGAYWKGDENNTMLTRIYGLAFDTQEELESYIAQREAAKERDHRKIGKELELFSFSELIGPGLPLFTPKGTKLRELIVEKIHRIQAPFGYERVSIPHITKKELYEHSGHWEKFEDELFHVKGKSEAQFVMKPMNCPHHTQIYAAFPKSYRDLPVRYTESTMVYRDEQAGELLGLGRVRSITQDDGHVFCTEEQVEEEVKNIVEVIKQFYSSLGMWHEENYWVSLSVRDPEHPEKYLGDTTLWDKAEMILEKVAQDFKLPYTRTEGEAAFYGPKLDFMFHDALGRERQLGTAQLDFNMPQRFSLEYTDNEGNKKTPVMIHRAIAGSLERFLSIIIEHFEGWFPLWLAPTQVAIIPIKKEIHGSYAETVHQELKAAGMRVELWNDDHDGFGKKVRRAKNEKLPYWIIIGDEEMNTQTITLESKDDQNKGISLNDFLKKIEGMIE